MEGAVGLVSLLLHSGLDVALAGCETARAGLVITRQGLGDLFGLFQCGWLIAGSVWVFGRWASVDFEDDTVSLNPS